MIHPAGLGGIAAAGHRCTATVRASWPDSSARSMSPNTRARTATARPYSARKTRSIAVGSGLARGDTVRPGAVPGRGMPAGPRGPDPEPRARRSAPGTQSSASSCNGRTSTGAAQALVALAAHASAASRSAALITQNPPMCSLPSANGPSVISMPPSWTRTTVAVLAGWSPPANTHAPADCSSALKAATSWYIFCAASGGAGALPSTECTLSMYCFIEVLLPDRTGSGPAGPVTRASSRLCRSRPRRLGRRGVVGQQHDTVAIWLGVGQRERGGLVHLSGEQALAGAEHDREEHQAGLVDQAVLDQGPGELGAALDQQVAPELGLQLRDLGHDIAPDHRGVR